MKRTALIGIVLILVAGACQGNERRADEQTHGVAPPPPPTGFEGLGEISDSLERGTDEWAREVLLHTEVFGKDLSASLLLPAEAFLIVLSRAEAAAAFKDIFRRAKTSGKLYALAGLAHEDSAEFRRALQRFEGWKDTVLVFRGDVVEYETAEEIIQGYPPDQPRERGAGIAGWSSYLTVTSEKSEHRQ